MNHPMPSDELCARARTTWLQVVARAGELSAQTYVRGRDLAGLMRLSGAALWPRELNDHSIEGTARLIARIQFAVTAVEVAGITQHHSYDVNRHIALLGALNAERARLNHLHQQRIVKLHEAAE
jgi:hypothetical protein